MVSSALHLFLAPAFRGRVRVGLFVGGMEEEPSNRMGVSEVITDKNELRKKTAGHSAHQLQDARFPVAAPRDQGLWRDYGPDTLRYLVVDELHTFDGAQGTDLACLIRRMKARLLASRNSLVCVGTSATLGTGGEQQALIHYASQVFQSPFGVDSIIGEFRQAAGEFLSEPVAHGFSGGAVHGCTGCGAKDAKRGASLAPESKAR